MPENEGNDEKDTAGKWIDILKWRVGYYQKSQETLFYHFALIIAALIAVSITGKSVDYYLRLPSPYAPLLFSITIAVFVGVVLGLIVHNYYFRKGVVYHGISATVKKRKLLLLIAFLLSKKWKTCPKATNEEWLNCVEKAFKDIEEIGIEDLDITRFCTLRENKCDAFKEKR